MQTLRQIIELSDTSIARPQLLKQPSEPVCLNLNGLEAIQEDYLAKQREKIAEIKNQGWQ